MTMKLLQQSDQQTVIGVQARIKLPVRWCSGVTTSVKLHCLLDYRTIYHLDDGPLTIAAVGGIGMSCYFETGVHGMGSHYVTHLCLYQPQ